MHLDGYRKPEHSRPGDIWMFGYVHVVCTLTQANLHQSGSLISFCYLPPICDRAMSFVGSSSTNGILPRRPTLPRCCTRQTMGCTRAMRLLQARGHCQQRARWPSTLSVESHSAPVSVHVCASFLRTAPCLTRKSKLYSIWQKNLGQGARIMVRLQISGKR